MVTTTSLGGKLLLGGIVLGDLVDRSFSSGGGWTGVVGPCWGGVGLGVGDGDAFAVVQRAFRGSPRCDDKVC